MFNLHRMFMVVYPSTPHAVGHCSLLQPAATICSSGINTTIKTTSVCDGDARSVDGGRGWLAGDTDGLAGWPAGR